MKLYFKNKKGQLEETTLFDVLKKSLKINGNIKSGSFSDNSGKWIEIDQESENSSLVTVGLSFEPTGNLIDGISVHEAKIKRVVDVENSKKIV